MSAPDSRSIFSNEEDSYRLVTGEEAVELLERSEPTRQQENNPEQLFRVALIQNLLHAKFKKTTVGFIRRYRFWDPILAADIVIPGCPELESDSSIPLGVIIEGAAEILAPHSVNFDLVGLPRSDPKILSYPTRRDSESEDLIEHLLLPGDPIGLFEAMDSLLFDKDERDLYHIKQRDYCIFSGSRTLYPCIPFGNQKLPKKWIGLDKNKKHVQLFADYHNLKLKRAGDVLTRDGALKRRKLSSDQFFRLLLGTFSPAPWSTYILFFDKSFFQNLMKREGGATVSKTAWSRMSQLESSRISINRLERQGPKNLVDQLIKNTTSVATGKKWCLVPYTQCRTVCNGTSIGNNHIDICNLFEELKEGEISSEGDHALLMVPGYLRTSGDWGIVPLKFLKKSIEQERSWFERVQQGFQRYCDSTQNEKFEVSYLGSIDDLKDDYQLYAAAKRQSGGTAASGKFLFPSILIKLR